MSDPPTVHVGTLPPEELVAVAALLASTDPDAQGRGVGILQATPYLLDLVSGFRRVASEARTAASLTPQVPFDRLALDQVGLIASIPDRLADLRSHSSARVRRRASRLAQLWSEGLAEAPGGFQAFFWRRFAMRSMTQTFAIGAVFSAAGAPFVGWWSLTFLAGFGLVGIWLYRRFARPRAV